MDLLEWEYTQFVDKVDGRTEASWGCGYGFLVDHSENDIKGIINGIRSFKNDNAKTKME